MNDPFGAVLTLIRDDPAVNAIVAGRVSSEIEALPCVQIIPNATSREPFGPGSGRLGLQYWSALARCYAADTPTGLVQSRQLAGAVSDAIHNHRPVTVGARLIIKAYAPDIDGPVRDPQVNYPYHDVVLNVYAAAQAVA